MNKRCLVVKIAIVFYSASGTTRQLANAVAAGAAEVADIDVVQVEIISTDINAGRFQNDNLLATLDNAAAIVFGSPTYMGSVSAQFKAFADASSERWEAQVWRNKIAAGFTIGSNLSGDQLSTLQYLQILSSQHGMLWTGVDIPGANNAIGTNRLGAQSGVIAHSADGLLHETDVLTARYLGRRVALNSKKLTA